MLNYRKDSSPKNTIKQIKKILRKNNIKTKEYRVKNINKSFFSVRIEIKGFYNMGTNGKGITPTLARASGYAELMERIQSRILINNYFLNKRNDLFNFYDECLNDDIFKNSDLINSFFSITNYKKLFTNHDKYKVLDVYKDVVNNKDCYLPTKLIYLTSSSNGLCAGNNYYEAVNQGMAEIFERYIYKKILFDNLLLIDVKIDDSLPIYKKIVDLEKNGYTIRIKDCSNDVLPVIGVLIIKDDKYLFTLGSDCDLNIAIQRCLTETFQGLSDYNQINKKMKSIHNNYDKLTEDEKYVNWLQCYASNNGIHPQNIFSTENVKNYKDLKIFKSLPTNKEVFDYMIKIIKKLKLNIFIKDYSYLGFSTYKIYIPKLSNISFINDKEIVLYNNYDNIKEIYFDIENFNDRKKITNVIKVLKTVMNSKKYSLVSLGNFFHTERYLKTNYNNITFQFLVGLLELKLYNEIHAVNEMDDEKVKSYFNQINSIDNNINRFNFVLKDLNLKTPSCPNCNLCKLKNKCKYKNWQRIDKILKEKEALFRKTN